MGSVLREEGGGRNGHDVRNRFPLKLIHIFIEFRLTAGALIGSRAPISEKSNGFHLEFRPFGELRQHFFSSKVFPSCFHNREFFNFA